MSAQVGINTDDPLSSFHNVGSYAGNYIVDPGTNYTLGDDYIVDYTNNSPTTVYTLPSISEGTATNRNGRMYFIRNGSSTNALTIKAPGAETISYGTINSNTYSIAAGHSAIIARNATVSGGTNTTWNILNYADIGPPSRTYLRTVSTTNSTPLALVASNNSTATAITLNTTGTAKNLFSTNLVLTRPKTVRFIFTTGIDDSGADVTSTPYIYYYLEIYNTATNVVATGTGANSQLSIQMQMIGSQNANFTLTDEISLPQGSYNARLKCFYGANSGNFNLGFVSYSIVASYQN